MVVPQLRCRSECFDLVSVEVEMQPDREHAERDDAAVEVAAHLFFVSLSRGFLRERCVSFARLAPRVAAVVKTWCCVAFLAQLMRAKLC